MLGNPGQIILKGHQAVAKSLDRHALEFLALVKDYQFAVVWVNPVHHILSDESLADVVRPFIDGNRSISADFAYKPLTLDVPKPTVGIDPVRQAGQGGQAGEGNSRWLVATGAALVGTFMMIMVVKMFESLGSLPGVLWQVHLDAFTLQRAMQALDIRVFVGTMRWTDLRLDAQAQQKENPAYWPALPSAGRDQSEFAQAGRASGS